MDIPQDVKTKIGKSVEAIYSKGFTDGKSSKKNQTQNEKDLVRFAESVAKRVDGNKNIPTEKKMRGSLTKSLEEISRDGLFRLAGDALALASTMPKAVKAPKAPKAPKATTN